MPELEPDATTELLPRARAAEPEPAAAPVFVDASGRRRRLAHRIATSLFLAAAAYSLMVIWSLLGGPVSPDTLMPFSVPPPVVSTARATPAASQTAGAVISVPSGSSTSGAGTAAASPSDASPRVTKTAITATASISASASTSASAAGHRPTAAPGKPTGSPTNGHGH